MTARLVRLLAHLCALLLGCVVGLYPGQARARTVVELCSVGEPPASSTPVEMPAGACLDRPAAEEPAADGDAGMCTTEATSAVAPRPLRPVADARLDAGRRCGHGQPMARLVAGGDEEQPTKAPSPTPDALAPVVAAEPVAPLVTPVELPRAEGVTPPQGVRRLVYRPPRA
jgi:hypothetical protein